MGDLDGDRDIDAFVGNRAYLDNSGANTVWLNDGDGNFTDSGQFLNTLVGSDSKGIALGDLDADGDLDAYVANEGQDNEVWLNDGSGIFTNTFQSMGRNAASSVAMGDLDNDGDIDAFVSNLAPDSNVPWFNSTVTNKLYLPIGFRNQ